jgi:hypothetical protein
MTRLEEEDPHRCVSFISKRKPSNDLLDCEACSQFQLGSVSATTFFPIKTKNLPTLKPYVEVLR